MSDRASRITTSKDHYWTAGVGVGVGVGSSVCFPISALILSHPQTPKTKEATRSAAMVRKGRFFFVVIESC